LKNIALYVFGSKVLFKIFSDLDIFKEVVNNENINISDTNNSVSIFFLNNSNLKTLHKFLNLSLPTIIISNQKHIIRKKLNPNNFTVFLQTPIEIHSLFEIIRIALSKYNFFKNSSIFLKNYNLNANSRFIEKSKKKVKLTEIELKLILCIGSSGGKSKIDIIKNVWKHENILDTHAFETTLYRLRKKIKDNYNDDHFVIQKSGKYYLS